MGILCVDFNNINVDVSNFYEDDPKTSAHVILSAWQNKLKQRKAFKKEISKELMPIAWHPTTWWDWCMWEDEGKEIEQFLLIKINIKFLVLFQLK